MAPARATLVLSKCASELRRADRRQLKINVSVQLKKLRSSELFVGHKCARITVVHLTSIAHPHTLPSFGHKLGIETRHPHDIRSYHAPHCFVTRDRLCLLVVTNRLRSGTVLLLVQQI